MTDKVSPQQPNARKQARFFETESEPPRAAKQWYFRAREGVFGPFASREVAENELADLILRHPDQREEYLK